jgi:nucleotide-binding universal stress UspA family protein
MLMLNMTNILCPTDFSDASDEALDYAAGMAARFSARLCLLHVTQPVQPITPSAAFPEFAGFDTSGYEDVIRDHAESEMRERLKRPSLADVNVVSEVRRGYPADEILRVAEEMRADLIVIATHGATGWRRYVFGSVTEKVLHQASCPVLVTPVREPNGAR